MSTEDTVSKLNTPFDDEIKSAAAFVYVVGIVAGSLFSIVAMLAALFR